jgi:hypothetical protein
MSDKPKEQTNEDWIRKQLDSAVEQLIDLGAVSDRVAEARPVWSLPGKIVLGQIRDSDDPKSFKWFVSGDVRTDFIDGNIAAAPRDALRHFSLKWQLDVGRYTDPAAADRLIGHAEELYDMVEEDRLWVEADI